MKCNKGGVTGRTDVAGTRERHNRELYGDVYVKSTVWASALHRSKGGVQADASAGTLCVAGCYHMWQPTLVLVSIALPHRNDPQCQLLTWVMSSLSVVNPTDMTCCWFRPRSSKDWRSCGK